MRLDRMSSGLNDVGETASELSSNRVPRVGRQLRRAVSVLAVLLLCSLALNVLLVIKLRNLKAYAQLIRSESQLSIGEVLPSFVARDPDGRQVKIEYNGAGGPTVLYIFSPDCGWCNKSNPGINAVAQQSNGRYRVIGLSLSGENLKYYVEREGLRFPVYTELPFQVISKYKLGGTPHTVIMSPDGLVLRSWKGAYEGPLKKTLEEFLDVRLPEVQ